MSLWKRAWPPVTVQHPKSLTIAAGENATFSVEVTNNATLPIGYQLRKGGAPITNVVLFARTCALTLFNVTTNTTCPTNGPGYYRIVVTNAANCSPGVGRSTARLTVLPAPLRPEIGHCAMREDACFHLQFDGETGMQYTVLVSTNLVDRVAVGVAAEIGAGQFKFIEPAAMDQPTRFYRLRTP